MGVGMGCHAVPQNEAWLGQQHCRVPLRNAARFSPRPLSSALRALAEHMMWACSHLHLNGLLCTDETEMSYGGLTSLPWQKPSCCHCSSGDAQQRGGRSVVAAGLLTCWLLLDPLEFHLSSPQMSVRRPRWRGKVPKWYNSDKHLVTDDCHLYCDDDHRHASSIRKIYGHFTFQSCGRNAGLLVCSCRQMWHWNEFSVH